MRKHAVEVERLEVRDERREGDEDEFGKVEDRRRACYSNVSKF